MKTYEFFDPNGNSIGKADLSPLTGDPLKWADDSELKIQNAFPKKAKLIEAVVFRFVRSDPADGFAREISFTLEDKRLVLRARRQDD